MGRRRSGMVTLTDVAARAGVSVATASKALNNRAEVAEETRARVRRAAAELSFRPNALAQGLISGRTRTIGLLTDELGGRFSMPVLLGVENALGNEEMSVVLCDARGDVIRRQHYIRTLLARQVDGFVILGESNDVRPSLTRDIPVPVVYVYGESSDSADLSILADDRGGARLAAAHLIALRRRRIAHITGPESYRAARDRAGALQTVLDEAGLGLAGGEPFFGEWSRRWGRHATRMLITAAPEVDAIFCGNDQIADGACEALAALGRRIPDDVAVVGYDNWEALAADCRPPLTTIDLNLEQLGAAAVEHLSAALDGHRTAGVVRQPGRLVVRESTGPLPRHPGD
ncbi:LacI family DNA-binding transcriptional regulator [Microbispora sp. NBRC 16548]|uniref:LacI family DNA-binding transcriptional regulator n=1 Tax=Microbispora sp. NBRC 16548 TaxID=3030994 RepID=UPI0024A518D4|nr:LacI family DNA-binding transcriptional regulator [Microbispora sp. NBRC 16548]GLX06245.1 LacI family transcriptional regulator [Microbispora sp. NBRC 16548]